jgi:hypothetical protein
MATSMLKPTLRASAVPNCRVQDGRVPDGRVLDGRVLHGSRVRPASAVGSEACQLRVLPATNRRYSDRRHILRDTGSPPALVKE